MKYLPLMTEDEIQYVCSVIPLRESVLYFMRYPKDFGKIMPGFRATSLRSQEQASGVLFRKRNQPFVSSFIEKHISRWLDKINAAISEKTGKGDSRETALLQTLPHCFFVDNIELYFKLSGEEHSQEFLSMLGESISLIKDYDTKCERIKSLFDAKVSEIGRKESELERVQSELDKAHKEISELLDEIKMLKRTNAGLEKSKEIITSLEQAITNLKQKTQERENYIQQLRIELSDAKNEQLQLEQKIEEIVKQQEPEKHGQSTAQKPKCPKDLDDFRDYLGYNFENIGVPIDTDYYSLLKDHLSEILFQGKPIIINRSSGFSLMQCISNTLVKTPVVSTLAFANEVSEKSIDDFLSQDKRVLCLDNFIGNYNETTLITVCDRHRDKIVFLTVTYDRTLRYVPEELMKYCHYINLNRIEAFTGDKVLTEDPSIVDEIETLSLAFAPDARWASFMKEILDEFGICGALSAYKSSLVANELSLCRMLAFDVLPYCADVLVIAPFNISERLVKYAGERGRCQYKDLFGRWFA